MNETPEKSPPIGLVDAIGRAVFGFGWFGCCCLA
jgi:hypothetical protein